MKTTHNQYTLACPNMQAVCVSVPSHFVGMLDIFDWVRTRRAMSWSTFQKCCLHLRRLGLIQREPRTVAGRYRFNAKANT